MNKIDDFYEKKESLEKIITGLEHYIFYYVNVIQENDSFYLKVRLNNDLGLDKKYMSNIYYKLERELENMRDKLEKEVIKSLKTELEELRIEIKKDFDFREVNKVEN